MQPITIIRNFKISGTPISCEPFGHGHINSTYKITTDTAFSYILQHINKFVFSNPPQLMENASRVTNFIRGKGSVALHFIEELDGSYCFLDGAGEYWRCYEFVEGFSMDIAETPEDFYQSALAFGKFQDQLSDFPAETLYETIPNFHNTPDRFRQLKEAIDADSVGRLSSAKPEVDFYLANEAMGCRLQQMLAAGEIPLRVTHNDTKLNNVLLDNKSHKPLCVLDLDTVMPGLSVCDFGDSIRFGANTAAEDEPDMSKMKLDIDLFRIYTKGFLESALSLTEAEVKALPLGAFTMTLECGSRFLKDYLDGDKYFRIAYPEHNLIRCRTQMALCADMLKRWDEMEAIVAQVAKEVRG